MFSGKMRVSSPQNRKKNPMHIFTKPMVIPPVIKSQHKQELTLKMPIMWYDFNCFFFQHSIQMIFYSFYFCLISMEEEKTINKQQLICQTSEAPVNRYTLWNLTKKNQPRIDFSWTHATHIGMYWCGTLVECAEFESLHTFYDISYFYLPTYLSFIM